MPFGAIAGGVASAAVGSLLGGGGSTGSSSAPAAYIPYNQSGLDQSFNNYYGQYGNTLGNYYSTVSPLASTLLNNQYYNPATQNYLNGAGYAQQAYYGLGQNANNAAGVDYNLGGQLANAAQNWGLNGAELQQLQQQSADTANAQSYLRGIQGSPYGASVATNAVDQTNLNYALNQAQTQASLAGAATGAYGAGTNQLATGANAYGAGANSIYNAYGNLYGGQNQALTNYYGATSPYLQGLNQLQSNALGYMGYGTTAQNTAANQALASQQNTQQLYGGLVSGGANLGNQLYQNYYGAGSGGGGYNFSAPGGSMYSNPSTYDYSSGGGFGSGYFGLGY